MFIKSGVIYDTSAFYFFHSSSVAVFDIVILYTQSHIEANSNCTKPLVIAVCERRKRTLNILSTLSASFAILWVLRWRRELISSIGPHNPAILCTAKSVRLFYKSKIADTLSANMRRLKDFIFDFEQRLLSTDFIYPQYSLEQARPCILMAIRQNRVRKYCNFNSNQPFSRLNCTNFNNRISLCFKLCMRPDCTAI